MFIDGVGPFLPSLLLRPACEVITLNEHHRHRYDGQAKCEEEDDIGGVAHV